MSAFIQKYTTYPRKCHGTLIHVSKSVLEKNPALISTINRAKSIAVYKTIISIFISIISKVSRIYFQFQVTRGIDTV